MLKRIKSINKNVYVNRANNLSNISIINLVVYAIAALGSSINLNSNVSLVSQLSVLYTILNIPYSMLVMTDNHHYLPLPQGALLSMISSGCVPLRLINRGEIYEKLLTFPSTTRDEISSKLLSPQEFIETFKTLNARLREIRQNQIHL